MKRLLFLLAGLLMIEGIQAQEAQSLVQAEEVAKSTAETPVARRIILQRARKTYFYGNEIMQRKEMLNWYAQHNCRAAYEQFRSGYKLVNAGWWCLGAGLFCTATGIGCTIAGSVITASNSKASSSSSSSSTHTLSPLYFVGVGVIFAGGILETASIPCLLLGYVRMHQSVNTFNTYQSVYSRNPQPYWAIQSSRAGLGLAFHF